MYLLDTPILFELGRVRSEGAEPGLAAWAAGVARDRLFVSALSLIELETGAVTTARRDKPAGAALRAWIDEQLVPAFDGHILPLDTAVARRRGQLALGETRDALLAATALEHGLTLVTRNTAAYRGARVKLFDPRGYAPEAEDAGDWRAAAKAGPLWLKNLFVRA